MTPSSSSTIKIVKGSSDGVAFIPMFQPKIEAALAGGLGRRSEGGAVWHRDLLGRRTVDPNQCHTKITCWRLVSTLTDKAGPFTKVRLVKLAEKYDEQLGLGSKPARHRKMPIGLPQISVGASER
jgi:hypothetical protein